MRPAFPKLSWQHPLGWRWGFRIPGFGAWGLGFRAQVKDISLGFRALRLRLGGGVRAVSGLGFRV